MWRRGVASFTRAQLTVEKTSTPKHKLEPSKLVFGNSFTDHMLETDWSEKAGWTAPTIRPFHDLVISPAASCLHYALQGFEGLKAYVDEEGRARMFRPDMNVRRMLKSAQRLCFPEFDPEQLLECMKELVKVDRDWIPNQFGYSLYLRPTMISTHPFLGVAPSKHVKLFVIMSPVGPYYKEGFSAVSLYADTTHVRAWPGGSGDSKIGPNYGPTILHQVSAAKKGYSQVLWLIGKEHYVTEVGTMNQFFLWREKNGGGLELVTAPLDGTILPGVTRDSILTLCREWNEFKVSERPYTMKEVVEAVHEGRMIESFGAGTAAIVSPVKKIHYQGEDLVIPLDPEDTSSQAGKLAKRLSQSIMDIQYGRAQDPHGWSIVI